MEPHVWKIEELERRADCENVTVAPRQQGRNHVGFIILGRGGDDANVREWLSLAAAVPGFIGFDVDRTIFREPLVNWLAKKITGDQAVD